jgi:uncharacterized protein (TIGR03435 family)
VLALFSASVFGRGAAESPRAQAVGSRPQFDVVSVKACDPNAAPSPPAGGRGSGVSPGRIRLDCRRVSNLIFTAYVSSVEGRSFPPAQPPTFDFVHAAPDWIQSEAFTIEATTAAETRVPVMLGPMLRAVLEDRFKLKTHVETREVPVLELVVGKGGSKLTPFTPGACVLWDFNVSPQPPLEPGQHRCASSTDMGRDGNWVENVEAMTLDDWLRALNTSAAVSGRWPIVNKTGITGLQTFRWEYSGRSDDLPTEIKQLGLELRPGKARQDFLIIDHVERPSPD